jgi:hypothetical protein
MLQNGTERVLLGTNEKREYDQWKKAKETKKPVQVKKEETKTSKDKHPEINVNEYVKSKVYEYKNANGEEYIEAHIDMIANYNDRDDDYFLMESSV